MKNRLKNKLVIVTGATSGIGRAAAELFAESGCRVVITGRREKRLSAIKSELVDAYDADVVFAAFDVRDRRACRSFVEKIEDPVDILINNAGLAKGTDAVYGADFEDWDTMIDTNIKGLLNITRFVTAGMKEQNSGHVINIGSISGHESYAGGSVYCATKHAVKAITEAAKKDLHGTPIRVSMVSPGLVETEFSNVRFDGDHTRADEVYKNMQPLTPQDVAEVIHFIANRPPHVNILDSIILPVAQSASTMVARDD